MNETLKAFDELLRNIGRCITQWADIEEKLFEICVLALKAPRKQVAIVYYKTPSLDARLTLLAELVGAIIPPRKSGEHSSQIEKKWKNLTLRIKKLLPERNALAHFPIKEIFVPTNNPNGPPTKSKLSIRPHRNERLRGRKISVEKMEPEDLPRHLAEAQELEMNLRVFLSDLRQELHV